MNAKSLATLYKDTVDEKNAKKIFAENYVKMIDDKYPELDITYKIDYLHKASITGANPAMNEIFLIPRYESVKTATGWEKRVVGSVQFSYHFFLARATEGETEMSFSVASNVEETFSPVTNRMSKQLVSTAMVYKTKDAKPIVYKARWHEFAQRRGQGGYTKAWESKSTLMLEKCALANAMRWAYPHKMAGIYVQEEMPQSNPEEQQQQRQQQRKLAQTQKAVADQKSSDLYKSALKKLMAELRDLFKHATLEQKRAIFQREFGPYGVNIDNIGAMDLPQINSCLAKLERSKSDLAMEIFRNGDETEKAPENKKPSFSLNLENPQATTTVEGDGGVAMNTDKEGGA